MSASLDRGRDWQTRARRVRLKVDLGVWLARAVPLIVGLCLVAAMGLLMLRRIGAGEGIVWIALAAGSAIAAAAAWRLGRAAFFTQSDALVHLDVVNGLDSRLECARQGVGDWPERPARISDGLRWRWRRIVPPLAFAALLLGVAERIPVSRAIASAGVPAEEPGSWRQVEKMLESLEKESIADPTSLASFQEKLDELRRRSREKWYDHGSLEAGDSLRDRLRDGLRAMGGNLDRASQSLTEMGARRDSARMEMLEKLSGQFEDALSGLEMGTLPLSPELLSDLQGFDPSNVRRLTPEEMRALRDRLARGARIVQGVLGDGDGDGTGDELVLMSIAAGMGNGGVDRGPGVAPMWLNPEKTDLHTKRLEAVSNEDMSRSALGDLVGVGRTEHRIDKGAWSGPVPSGSAGSLGTGGEAVWKAPLLPDDQQVLRRYFR